MTYSKSDKRTKIRIASYISIVIIALCIWGITATVKNSKYEKQLSVSHQRTISALATYLDSIETDLRKMQYVNTRTMTSSLSLSLCKATAGAKNCLSEISAGDTQLYNINKFLSQAGDYVQSINKKVADGETLTADDHTQVKKLYDYSVSLSDKVSYMEEYMYAGNIKFEDTVSTLSMITSSGDTSISYLDTVSDAEESFSDYPTLLYDGPFADNILTNESKMLKDEKEISENDALLLASKFTGIDKSKLIRQEDENSNIQSYIYYYDGTTAAITKKGGYMLYVLSDDYAGEEKLSIKEAIAKGKSFLDNLGYVSMKDSYYSDNDGICTINFAYTLGDVICYSDLIKVSVALDSGKIVSADATAYLMNHTERGQLSAKVTMSEAISNISSALSIKETHRAIIPTDDGNEVYTYEFLCSDSDKNDVLVYIDAETGNEADVMLLLYSDGGILTR